MKPRLAFLLLVAAVALFLWQARIRLPESVDMIAPPAPARAPASEQDRAVVAAGQARPVPPILQNALSSQNLSLQQASVRNLPDDLSPDAIDHLIPLLKAKRHSPKVPRGFTLALQNDLLLALRHQTNPPAILPEVLTDIFRDPEFDIGLRDYAVQHLASWYEEIILPRPATPETREAGQSIIQVLTDALRETDLSIAGTALLSLHRLSALDSNISLDRSLVGETALRFVNDPAVGELTKITAIQICAERGDRSVLPVITGFAQSDAALPLRLSAIAALGALGREAERPLLEAFATRHNSPLAGAARLALNRIESRTPPGTATPRI